MGGIGVPHLTFDCAPFIAKPSSFPLPDEGLALSLPPAPKYRLSHATASTIPLIFIGSIPVADPENPFKGTPIICGHQCPLIKSGGGFIIYICILLNLVVRFCYKSAVL